jgi:hypothetical protein
MTAAVQRLGKRRTEHAAETLLDAANASGIPLGEFLDQAVADDRRHELFARSLRVAQDTALRAKRRALGRALAVGVMGDDARIDEELLCMRAIDDLDEMHIRLLGRMDSFPSPLKWTPSSIVSADPGLAAGIGALELHGMIMQPTQEGVTWEEIDSPEIVYCITEAGREFLNRLADEPDA